MRFDQLEHILRAASEITGADQIVVIGSQAILAQFPSAPGELLASVEADVFTFRDPKDADAIEGSIGELSPFHQTFGIYAQGVGEETAVLPRGWRERLVRLRTENTGGATGLCLEVHDLAVSKLVAGREKDREYVGALIRHKLASVETIGERLEQTPLDDARRELCVARLARLTS